MSRDGLNPNCQKLAAFYYQNGDCIQNGAIEIPKSFNETVFTLCNFGKILKETGECNWDYRVTFNFRLNTITFHERGGYNGRE